jgi:hypothetical protein
VHFEQAHDHAEQCAASDRQRVIRARSTLVALANVENLPDGGREPPDSEIVVVQANWNYTAAGRIETLRHSSSLNTFLPSGDSAV